MFKRSTRRFPALLVTGALVAVTAPSVAGAAVVFSSDFESDTVGNRPAWTSVTDNNNATDPTVKYRVDNTGDPFGTGVVGQNKYLLMKDTSNSVGGNATVRGLTGAADVATLSFDFVEPARTGTGNRVYVQVGQTTATLGTDADRAYQWYFTDGFMNSPGGPGTTYTVGTKHSLAAVMNYSASSINYTGIDGASRTVASGKYDLYIDGVLKFDDAARYTNGANATLPIGTALSAFNVQSFGGDTNQEFQIDNIVLQTGAPVPEPTAAGIAGLGLTIGATARRRRRIR